MQTLGLASEQKPSDGMFKRLFWPTIENQYDVDLVGQQGFWVCVGVAVLSAVLLSLTGHFLLGPIIGITYLLGGTGVRERSLSAALLVFLCFFLDKLSSLEVLVFGMPYAAGNPVVGIVCLMLLLANVRATLLARRWTAEGTLADQVEVLERSESSFSDKIANVMPAKVWPVWRFVFYPLAGVLLLLTLLGMLMIPSMHRTQTERQRQQDQQLFDVEPGK